MTATAHWTFMWTSTTAVTGSLERDAPDNDRGDAELLVYAADALRTGRVPADVRAAIYRAFAKIPSLQITEREANLDGAIGTAFAVDDGNVREEIIIDATTGEFIGENLSANGRSPSPTSTTHRTALCWGRPQSQPARGRTSASTRSSPAPVVKDFVEAHDGSELNPPKPRKWGPDARLRATTLLDHPLGRSSVCPAPRLPQLPPAVDGPSRAHIGGERRPPLRAAVDRSWTRGAG